MITAKKKLKQNRMKQYLIQATREVVQKESYQDITIRKISAASGYNSATIYNYFKNLDELISLTLIDFVIPYFKAMTTLLKIQQKSYITFLLIWKTYAMYSFREPDIYTHVFYSEKTAEILGKLPVYIDLYASAPLPQDDELLHRSLGRTIQERDDLAIDPCIKDGYFKPKDKGYITDFSYALSLGMCRQIKVEHEDAKKMTARFIDYQIDFLLQHSTINETKSNLVKTISEYEF